MFACERWLPRSVILSQPVHHATLPSTMLVGGINGGEESAPAKSQTIGLSHGQVVYPGSLYQPVSPYSDLEMANWLVIWSE
jgi:hypothetical protein